MGMVVVSVVVYLYCCGDDGREERVGEGDVREV